MNPELQANGSNSLGFRLQVHLRSRDDPMRPARYQRPRGPALGAGRPCQGRSQATWSMRRMAASRAPTAAASCSLPSGPRGSRMARSSWAAMSSFIPRSRSWLPSVIGHLSLYETALVVELLRRCSPLRGLACASVFALSASFSSALGPHVSMVAFSGPCQALCLWHPQLLERAPDRRDGTAP